MSLRFPRLTALSGLAMLGAPMIACAPHATADATPPTRVLRVCADPNNLPFSNARLEGFENRIADIVARALDARLEYVWRAQRRGFVRHSLGAGACDVLIGVPHHFAHTATTNSYYRSTYVFLTRFGTPIPRSLDDPLLTHMLVGVPLIGDDYANSPPAHALAARGIINNVRGYTVYGDYRDPTPSASIVDAVATRAIDVAIVWGPLAGFAVRRSAVPLVLTPVPHEMYQAAVPFAFAIAMGVAPVNTPLRNELNAVIASERAAIDRVLDEYGIPRVPDATQESRPVTNDSHFGPPRAE